MDVIHLAKALQRTAYEVLSDAFEAAEEPLLGYISYRSNIHGGLETDGAVVKIKAYDPPVGEHRYRIIVIEET